ncbi:SDR family oxidoreductase [Novosphingobium piscinae]|uniref:Glucose 1-dehydrogenase n=1 Tax=Novosphingobium piscinae TaxID=1507448 RepID=A0A7X1FZQ4_9SPHN|nr:SDR family oxidoreductase [Novosphingobium piscinae]MBC2669834.1 glucose 1-dehydrogenase [Novosphingobium piscinae]
MTGRVAGKRALITGAAQGLGAAIAAMLAREGARVALADINRAGVEDLAARLNAAQGPGTAVALTLDVTDAAAWPAAIATAAEAMGGLSVLVNNAGIASLGTIESVDPLVWDRTMAVNVDSVFHGCRAALPVMRDCGPGSIVNISSIAGLIASPAFAAYNTSKAAVWMLTKSIALHCAREGYDIRCNSVHPTFVRTPLIEELGRGTPEEREAKLARQIPLGRLGEPDDVAYAVLYLASDESRMMTGAELKLDGGMSAM